MNSIGEFSDSISGIWHEVHEQWHVHKDVLCRGFLTYLRLDNSRLKTSFFNAIKLRERLAVECRIFIDPSSRFDSIDGAQ